MNTSSHRLSAALDADVRALNAQIPDDSVLEAAQRRLEDAIARSPETKSHRRISAPLSLAAVGVAALVVLGFLIPTLFVNQGVAFAEVQKHLRDFKTLTMTVTQRSNGMDLPTIHAWTDRRGNAHTTVGDSTRVIVNADSGTVLVLQHQSRRALRMSFVADKGAQEPQAFAWLKSVREFQGRAKRLKGTRTIDGQTTYGWSLEAGGMHIVLWADNDGVPRFVSVNNGKTLTERIQVSLDVPIKSERFSTRLPPGYTLEKQD